MEKRTLIIAGSDPLSGGGLQADIKTFERYNIFSFCSITCLGVIKNDDFILYDIDSTILSEQLNTIKQATKLDGIKIGLINNIKGIDIVADFIKAYPNIPIVLDPVLAFKETSNQQNQEYTANLINKLFSLASIITPNLKEAQLLSGIEIDNVDDMIKAAHILYNKGAKKVVIKGGERILGNKAYDVYYDGEIVNIFEKDKLATKIVNGAGCTFASALLAGLVNGDNYLEAIEQSKEFVYDSIKYGIVLDDETGNTWIGNKYVK